MTTNTHIAARLATAANNILAGKAGLEDSNACIDAANALEAVPALDAQGEAFHNLRTRCAEILDWQKTGILKGEELRAYAATKRYASYTNALQCAETDTAREAFELIVATPLPNAVGKPLSEAQAFAISAPIFGGGNRYPSAELKLVRAIERAHGIVTKESGNG